MVSSHMYDLRAAAGVGMITVYIPREEEHEKEIQLGVSHIKSKNEGGEFDLVVGDFIELVDAVAGSRAS